MGGVLARGSARTHDSDIYRARQLSSRANSSRSSDLRDPCTGRTGMDNIESMKMSYDLLKTITDDFSESRILGSGTFGMVYKGVLANEEIAVKVLRVTTGLEDEDFINEFQNLTRLKHQNIVRLVGFCNESEDQIVEREDGTKVTAKRMHMALCFEYVENGNLSKHISDENGGLEWHIRYQIIKGICEGLKHLHKGLEQPIWHLDLKPDNILLDKEMMPKIADFGLSRLIGDDRTKTAMESIGTCGYWPPEYVKLQLFSSAFDIFSLGVIITKIMIGTEGYNSCADMPPRQFVNHIHNNWKKKLQENVKPGILDVYSAQVRTCIKIASKCLKEDRKLRPTIKEIVDILNDTERKTQGCLETKQSHFGEFLRPSDRSIITNSYSEWDDCGASGYGFANNMPECLPYELLSRITKNFSKHTLLGNGWFGRVYKGVYEDGRAIAVKVLKLPVLRNNDKDLHDVIEELSKVNHKNVIRLLAYCEETDSKPVPQNSGKYVIAEQRKLVLCFEYLQNGSLEKHISHELHGLDWCERYKIIKGICYGLRYLHEELSPPILHMNLKPSNILLDEDMVPRIADFGMSRLFGEQETKRTITSFGTMGDLPPEFITKQILTKQFDIHSLGVIMLKMITGKSAYSLCSSTSRWFIKSVLIRWNERLQETLDLRSVEGYCQQVKRCTEIALKCVEVDRHKRPNIGDVVRMLEETETKSIDDDHRRSNKLLDVHPMDFPFPSDPEEYVSCSLQLHNNEDDGVAFKLESKSFPSKHLVKLPLYGTVSPRSTYTLILTQKPRWSLLCNNDLVLQSIAVSYHQELRLQDHDQALVVRAYESLFDEAQETASSEVEVQDVTLKSDSAPPVEHASFELTRPKIQVIPSQNAKHVSSIDVHPTKPWIMTTHGEGNLHVWNYMKMVVFYSFKVTNEPVYVAKFIVRKERIVAGDGNGCIHVYSYDEESQEATSIEAHNTRITSLAVHPTDSYVLSSSHDDHLIKLWQWDHGSGNTLVCTKIFKGHSDRVTQVIFNPEDSCSFASASLDCTVKIWGLNPEVCNTITLGKHPDGLLCVDYIISADRLHLITGSKDGTAQIWDMETISCSEYLIGHAHHISVVYSHPELRKLITGSLDGTVRIWNSTCYRLEKIIAFNLGAVYCFGYIEKLQRIVVGCREGIATMEIKFP